jgi:hypothetical protein
MTTHFDGLVESILGASGGVSLATPGLSADLAALAWTLPEEGEALRIVEADFTAAARELGAEAAAVHAVAEVESGGRTGFDSANRPKILFETHKFRRHSQGKFNESHPDLTARYGTETYYASRGKDQWTVIREAFALDPHAAVKSASWGMFQVLGSNAFDCGWETLEQFVTDMFYSEGQHMRAFLGFCKKNNLTQYLISKDWASFASGYNGPDYAVNLYDTKMEKAYNRYAAM